MQTEGFRTKRSEASVRGRLFPSNILDASHVLVRCEMWISLMILGQEKSTRSEQMTTPIMTIMGVIKCV